MPVAGWIQRLWRQDIRFRLVAWVALSVLLSTLAFTTYSAWTLEADTQRRLHDKAQSTATLLSNSLARPLFDINTQAVQSVVAAVGADANVQALTVTSAEGTVYQSEPHSDGHSGGLQVQVRQPIAFQDGGRRYEVGELSLTLRGEDLQAQRRQQLVQVFWANLVLALLIVGLLYTAGRRLSKPLGDARRALETLSSGRTDIALSGLERQDQLGRLARAVQTFQHTLQRLHQTEQALVQANTALEARIAERTAHLEQALQQITLGQARLQSILDASLDAVIVTDRQGAVTEWSARATALLGWPASQARGQALAALISPPEQAALHTQWLQQDSGQRGAVTALHETQVRHRDGRLLPVEWGLAWLGGAGDTATPPVLCGFLRDISERKLAEAQAQAAMAKQAELIDLRTRFIAMASHEFRTPLTSILSSTELLRHYRDRMPAQEQVDLLGGIERGVHRMTMMLERVLVIGQSDAQALECTPRPLDLEAICQSIALDARAQHPHSRCHWSIELPAAGAQACLDESLLRHILGNLLSNALKYSPAGGRVGLAVSRQGPDWVFEVTDQGMGIPEADLPHLFESFHRASNARDLPGTGLGLSIAQRAARVHGGDIVVHSHIGQGSRFTVRLPDGVGLPKVTAAVG
jgi:two-component system sensor histidine kinase/response regulator